MTTDVKCVEAREPEALVLHLNQTGAIAKDNLSVSFEDTGLSRLVHRGSWQKSL